MGLRKASAGRLALATSARQGPEPCLRTKWGRADRFVKLSRLDEEGAARLWICERARSLLDIFGS
jgi:hypothetical protein